jgi:predicted dehydrogenase
VVGVGIVGLGFGVLGHLPAWQLEPRARVLALSGRPGESSLERARQLGIPFRDWPELLAQEEIQVLSLCVPPAQQPALIEAAAAAGKHIFCEKPVAANLSDAREALRAVRQSGVVHGIDLFFPEIPAWAAARECLAELGQLRHAHGSWLIQTRAFREQSDGWKTRADQGGGTLANFASHSFHYLEWLFGPLASLNVWETGGHPRGIQAGAHLLLRFTSGMTASYNVAADAYPGSGHRLEVYGQHGSLVLANNSGDLARGFSLDLSLSGQRSRRLIEPWSGQGDGRVAEVAKLTSRLLDCIEGKRRMTPGLEQGLRVQELLQAAANSLRQGRTVEVAA